MEIVANIYIDLSFNVTSYLLNAALYVPNASTYAWFEIINGQEQPLSNNSVYTLTNDYLYSEGDVLKTYKCLIDGTKVVNFYVIYKSFFYESIEYPITVIGNPLILDISYASYELEYQESQLLDVGTISGGILPYTYAWYNGTQLISGESGPTYFIEHSFNITEPIPDIFNTYYCRITSFGKTTPVSVVRFDVLFKTQPGVLAAGQNVTTAFLAPDAVMNLKVWNIFGGRRPLTIVWEKQYSGGEFSTVKTSSVAKGVVEDALEITNNRESFTGNITITYRATVTDASGVALAPFNYSVEFAQYYLTHPYFPAGTLIKVYDESNQLTDVAVENVQPGQWIPSNGGTKVRVKSIYMKSTTILPGDLHTLIPGVNLYKLSFISTDGFKYNYINNVNNSLDYQTVVFYHIETPNYLKYDILFNGYFVKSYGNHEASMRYDPLVNAYLTFIPAVDAPVENPDDVQNV